MKTLSSIYTEQILREIFPTLKRYGVKAFSIIVTFEDKSTAESTRSDASLLSFYADLLRMKAMKNIHDSRKSIPYNYKEFDDE